MMRNIANVVHDLKPIIQILKKKSFSLPNAQDAKEVMQLIEEIQTDTLMLEHYLAALEKNVQDGKIQKVTSPD